jgi:L-alanine-DL-glutamate epimerase-like enolase superfamily enzyme
MEPYHTGYLHGQISSEGEDFGVHVIAAIREAVGPHVGVLPGAHGHYNVFVDHKLDFRGDQLFLSDRPGLGVDLDVERLEATSVYRRAGA